jgi:peptide/nickel transport system substrate-binding protein
LAFPFRSSGHCSPHAASNDDDTPAVDPVPDDDDDEDDEPADEPTDDEDDEPDDEPVDDARYGGEIIVLGHHEVASLSPDDRGPTVHWTMITNIHDALVAIDWTYELVYELAESIDISDDGLEYTVNLRQGVLWHDGEEFNAEDVVYTYDFHRNPDNATVQGTLFQTIDTIEATDDHTVMITMTGPNSAFLRTGGQVEIVPEHHHGAIGEDAYKSDPIGTGPFMVEEYRPSDFTRLRAFEDHWRGRPYVDYFTERIIPEGSVRTIELQTGEADSIVWPPVIDDDLELYDDPNFRSYRVPTVSLNHFPLNNTHPVLGDKAIRQAMLYATDRQQVIDDVFLGAATIATANFAPTLDPWYNPDVKLYPYDLAMAEEVLEEGGWEMGDDGVRVKDGERAQFTCMVITGDQARLPEAEVVQQYLAAVGIEMEIQEAPLATIQEGQRDGTVDASLYNWTYGGSWGEPDPTATLHSTARNNWNLWRNDRVDELIAEGLRRVDTADRKEAYDEIQEIVAEEAPMLFMMFWDWFNHWSMRVQGLPEPDEILMYDQATSSVSERYG